MKFRKLIQKHRGYHQVLDLLPRGGLCFDLGAHFGEKSVSMLEKGFRVLMVEPQPTCVASLESLLARFPQAQLWPGGVSSESGALEMSISSKNPALSTFSDNWKAGRFAANEWDQKVQVEVTTLDRLIELFGMPQYIKIDVEGFELQVLRGLSTPVGVISLEFTSEFLDQSAASLQLLKKLGYSRFTCSSGESLVFEFDWLDDESLINKLREMSSVDPLFWGDIYASR